LDTSEPSIRPTVPDDLDAIGEIYARCTAIAASSMRAG
jgi:hypothetical protein